MSWKWMRPCSVDSGFLTRTLIAIGARLPEPKILPPSRARPLAAGALVAAKVEDVELAELLSA